MATVYTLALIFNMAMIYRKRIKVNSGAGTVRLRSPEGNVEVFYASSR